MKKSILILTAILFAFSIKAQQQPTFVTVTTIAYPYSAGTVEGGGCYEPETFVVFIATPAPGYSFSYWMVNGMILSMNDTMPALITGNITIQANFSKNDSTYNVTTSVYPQNAGTTTGAGVYNHGDTVDLLAQQNNNYTFANWLVNGIIVSSDLHYTFVATANVHVTANFTFNPEFYTITTEPAPAYAGSTTGDGGVVWGANITVKATANSGYVFTGWSENEMMVCDSPDYQFTVTGNRHLTANFSLSTAVGKIENFNPFRGLTNPTRGNFNLTANGEYQLQVYNSLGQQVLFTELITGNNSIELKGPGLYVAYLVNKISRQTFTQKLVVQN